jgi:hypothetical protein
MKTFKCETSGKFILKELPESSSDYKYEELLDVVTG